MREHPQSVAGVPTPQSDCDDRMSLGAGLTPDAYWYAVATLWPRLLAILGWRFPSASRMLCEDMVMAGALKKARQYARLTSQAILGEVLLAATDAMRAWRVREARFSDVLAQCAWPAHRPSPDPAREVMAQHDVAYYLAALTPLARERLLTSILSATVPPGGNHSQERWRLDTGVAKARTRLRRLAQQEDTRARSDTLSVFGTQKDGH